MKNFQSISLNERQKDGLELHMDFATSTEYLNELITLIDNNSNKEILDFGLCKQKCLEVIERFPLPVFFYPAESFILRCRPNEDDKVIFSQALQLSYNPNATLSRFNLDNDPAFYGVVMIRSSNDEPYITSINESFKELRSPNATFMQKVFTIGKWKVLKKIPCVWLTFVKEAFLKNDHVRQVIPGFAEFINRSTNAEDAKKCQYIFNYFSERAALPTDTNNGYILTTAFYQALKEFYGSEVGIIYSSPMTENCGLNVVLSKEILDNGFLKLDTIAMIKCIRDKNNFKTFYFEACSDFVSANNDGTFEITGLVDYPI